MSSPFLEIPEHAWVASNALAFAIRDAFPVNEGHTLVITKRPVATWFDATREEHQAILQLIEVVKQDLDARDPTPDGYNIGFNTGEAAGQTVMHLHVHVIPRYRGDMDDPRGGVRHVIPWKGNYGKPVMPPLAVGGEADPFLAHLRPLFARATDIAVLAAFVQDSGLDRLLDLVSSATARGARVRFVTGDYLAITQAEALSRMLDWEGAYAPGFMSRIIECERLPGRTRSFHPKSWRFEGPGFGVAFVGSSNVSESALVTGVEWNLRVERGHDPTAYERTKQEFEALWAGARVLTFEWVARYAARARKAALTPPPGESEEDPLLQPPQPHEIQEEALAALAASRSEKRGRALVVMATGLGKTLVAALDAEAYLVERGGPIRVLVLAHRRELLAQAAETFRRVLRQRMPGLRVGWFAEDRSEVDADLVLASVQKLSRPEHLERLASQRFDYVVVDEVHHADAASYRRILARLSPGFLLGLTATPDRADEGDVLGLFDDHVAFRADLDVGIGAGRLVPFAYFGLKDVVDYANIPWRNRRFDPDALAAAIQTDRRMERLWEAWVEHRATRSLVFCATISHVEYVQGWLVARGVRSVAVHSQPGSADREDALRALADGELDAICAVDLFNEGVDAPLVDRVVMLRPTESPIVFLQQLGRGLRVADGKERLTVIDFVGNHRVFLDHVRTLLSFAGKPGLTAFLETGAVDLPVGCSVEVELEAIELLRKLLPSGGSEVQRVYREIYASRGERPTMGELLRMGYSPGTLRGAHGGWFEFVAGEGHLTDAEVRTLEAARDWFRELETTAMTKCFKMVVLETLVEAEALRNSLPLAELARRCHEVLARSPELLRDLDAVSEAANGDSVEWRAYWRKNPIAAWTGTVERPGRWFRIDGDQFAPRLPIPDGLDDTFAEMTGEVVDYRLAQYRRRGETKAAGDAFECKVLWNKRDPILKLPSRRARPDVPSGELDVRLQDGRPWRFRLMAEFCNVARPVGSDRNELPDLLRRWFGPAAGRPGTAFRVRFSRSPDGWWIEPAGQVIELPGRGNVIAFPTLRAAAGVLATAVGSAPEAEEVRLPVKATGDDLFAVRATGDSMDGGPNPIHDGDWLLFKLARGVGLGAMGGRIALLQTGVGYGDNAYQVKRVVQEDGRWRLRSDNPGAESFDATAETTPIARLVETVHPESLAPPVGEKLGAAELKRWFGIEGEPRTGRVDGHLFVVVQGAGSLLAPDRVASRVTDRRPGETAFVLASVEESWRHIGVGRWSDAEGAWVIPDVQFETWRVLGAGRECSRRLPPGALERARATVEALLANVGEGGWVECDGKRIRVLKRAPKGGVRIDGGDGGFAPRTISLNDIAWCVVAKDDVAERGGILDEARVNKLRYLDGTPRGSTRWIDTGWALMLV